MEKTVEFDGKKYISARRVAEKYGYNPDYIGQLARNGNIDAKLVGRNWFVHEPSVVEHKINAEKKLKERDQKSSEDLREEFEEANGISHAHIAFRHDEHGDHTAFDANAVFEHHTAFKRHLPILALCFLFAVMIAGSGFFLFSSHQPVQSLNRFSEIPQNFFEDFQSGGGDIAHTLNQGFYSAKNKLTDFSRTLISKFSIPARLANFFKSSDFKPGVAIVPSAADFAKNEEIKKYVKESFSDEIEIVPDETGKSGVIKPVFKKENSQEYLYVFVPLKEGEPSTSANQSNSNEP